MGSLCIPSEGTRLFGRPRKMLAFSRFVARYMGGETYDPHIQSNENPVPAFVAEPPFRLPGHLMETRIRCLMTVISAMTC